jgi:type VII secretion-associated serine protease mycosin
VRSVRNLTAIGVVLTLLLLLGEPPAQADSVRDQEWYLGFLHIAQAHKVSQGEGIIVAVIDTGVNPAQPELAGNLLPGYDNMFGDNAWTDDDGHGTAMASLIAAHGKNSSDGALGIAPKAKIMPIRTAVTGDNNIFDVETGIPWAIDHGARVISMSFAATQSVPGLQSAITEALASDVVLVAGAGNRPEATQVGYPAAYPGVIAAAGVDQNGNHADVSVTGPEVVLSAPAVDIVAPHANGQYLSAFGTSDATAIIAGVAALVRSKYPRLSAAEVVHRLTATATDKGPPGRDDQYGYGIVNPVAALTADVPPLQQSPTATPSHPSAATTDTAAPASKAPVAVISIVIVLLVAAAAIGLVIARTRTRR